MITPDQIHRLETKVEKAVDYIARLKSENTRLRDSITAYERRIDELEQRIEGIRADQSEIERGILAALDQLEKVEDQASLSEATRVSEENEPDSGDLVRGVRPQAEQPADFSPVEAGDVTAEDEAESEEEPSRENELDIF